MATPRTQGKAVSMAGFDPTVQSDDYKPPSLPMIPPEYWCSILDVSAPNNSADALLFNERLAVGTEVLDFVLLVLLSEMETFRGKSMTFVKMVRQAVSSFPALKAIIGKTDAEYKLTPSYMEPGFLYLLGFLWDHASQDIADLVSTLRPMFAPLLYVAAAAYEANAPKDSVVDKAEEQENKRKKNAAAFMQKLRDDQAPYFNDLYASPSGKIPITLRSSPSLASLDLKTMTSLDPAILAPRHPQSPSTPGRMILPLPQPRAFSSFSVWDKLPSLEAELGLTDLSDERLVDEDDAGRYYPRSPTTPAQQDILSRLRNRLDSYEGYGVWASVPGPSGLEAELPLPDISIAHSVSSEVADISMSSRQGLLPPFQYQRSPPGRVSQDKLSSLFDASINLTELADKSGEFHSSSASTRLGTTERISKTGAAQMGSSSTAGGGAGGVSNKTSPLAPKSSADARRPLTPHNRR
ncbi:hypothetical protein C8R45DRAFT_1204305 [Mycena sanguinolenta]|nr:hypothetical protein C8R45DRAFT_1204305 [Mycena sanguinolenta]